MSVDLTRVAKMLRKNMTDAERMLWSILRRKNLGVKFRRQQPIGRYVVDFVCFEKKLVIEVDGGQHCDNVKDEERDSFLNSCGFKVLRFWNNEIFYNLEGVITRIMEEIKE